MPDVTCYTFYWKTQNSVKPFSQNDTHYYLRTNINLNTPLDQNHFVQKDFDPTYTARAVLMLPQMN